MMECNDYCTSPSFHLLNVQVLVYSLNFYITVIFTSSSHKTAAFNSYYLNSQSVPWQWYLFHLYLTVPYNVFAAHITASTAVRA